MTHRDTKITAHTRREQIRHIDEVLPHGEMTGLVRVMVAHFSLGDKSVALHEQFETHEIRGEDYAELNAEVAPAWAPGKPAGTYRNEDLWHFIDLAREKAREPKPPLVIPGGTRA